MSLDIKGGFVFIGIVLLTLVLPVGGVFLRAWCGSAGWLDNQSAVGIKFGRFGGLACWVGLIGQVGLIALGLGNNGRK